MTRAALVTWLPPASSAIRVSWWCFGFLGVSVHLDSVFSGFGDADVVPFPCFALTQENGRRSLCRTGGVVAIALASSCSTLIQGTHLFFSQAVPPGKPTLVWKLGS